MLYSCDSSPYVLDVGWVEGCVNLVESMHGFPLEIALWLQVAQRLANCVTALQMCVVVLSGIRGNLIVAKAARFQIKCSSEI